MVVVEIKKDQIATIVHKPDVTIIYIKSGHCFVCEPEPIKVSEDFYTYNLKGGKRQ